MIDLQHNLLTTLLGGALLALVAVGITQTVFLGRADVADIAPADEAQADRGNVDAPETGLADLEEYRVITDIPLFFADRRLPPVQIDGAEGEEGAEEAEEPMLAEVGELQVAVTGIIIDPEIRIALVTDTASNETQVMEEGMALEGEQAAWSLDSLSERNARFVSADGREAELELEVYTSQMAAAGIQDGGGRQADDRRRGRRGGRDEPDEEARARAEEVRRRVAERRAELRAEAERRRRQRE